MESNICVGLSTFWEMSLVEYKNYFQLLFPVLQYHFAKERDKSTRKGILLQQNYP